jgi:protein gp37
VSTGIEWTDATWNPVTGCQKVSPGCKHCYAEGVAERFWAKQYPPNADGSPRRFTDVRCHPERLDQPLRWRKPRMVFVNSMSDLFHKDVPDDFIYEVWRVMAACPQHTFQVLTKRPERMREVVAAFYDRIVDAFVAGVSSTLSLPPLPNVWLGVSVEDQRRADERREYLQETPAAVRFVSYEPALGEVDWTGWEFIDWLIVGGESGPGARPFDLAWARDAIAWAGAHGVAAFIKQIGARPYYLIDRGPTFERVDYPLRDRKGGDMEEWPADLRVRQFTRG